MAKTLRYLLCVQTILPQLRRMSVAQVVKANLPDTELLMGSLDQASETSIHHVGILRASLRLGEHQVQIRSIRLAPTSTLELLDPSMLPQHLYSPSIKINGPYVSDHPKDRLLEGEAKTGGRTTGNLRDVIAIVGLR